MVEPLNYVSGETPALDAPEAAPKNGKGLLGQVSPILPGILGSLGLLAVSAAVISVARAPHQHDRHPALAELMANCHRWERDMRHHRGALERLERALQHERHELRHDRRHALIGLARR
jgi:hypothetical protein